MISRQYLFIALLFLTIPNLMSAQTLNGEYRLVGVQDMASGFHFTPDGKFQYFNIYGAIDRQAEGTYTITGNTLQLHSNKKSGQDFPLVSQSKKGNGYTIRVQEPNQYLRNYVVALFEVNGQQEAATPDDDGVIHIESEGLDTIYLMHELFADAPCLLKDAANTNNTFEVKLSPSLAQVTFQGIDFTIDGDELHCEPNYLLPFRNVRFIKE